MNFFPTFCPRLSEETEFYFHLGPDTLILHSVGILVFEKSCLLFKLIFKETQLQKNLNMISFRKLYFAI